MLNLKSLEAALKKAEDTQTRMEGRREQALDSLKSLGFTEVEAARTETETLRASLADQTTVIEQRENQLREKFPQLFEGA